MPEECAISDSIIETGLAKVYYSEEEILCIDFTEEYIVEPEDVYAIREAMLKLTEGNPTKVLVLPGKYGSVSKEAREMDMFYISDKSVIKAVAVVTKQLHQKLLGTLYFKFKRKNYPYKLFNEENKAKVWLLS